MATLIFDIETTGKNWDDIPESTQYSLTKWIGQQPISDTEKERLSEEAQEKLGLSPFTGEVVSLAMYDLERKQGVVYFVADDSVLDYSQDGWKYKVRSEKQILEDFWESANSYDVFVTFNGRSFDIPFLIHRSIINDVRPSVALVGQRYITRQTTPYHVDLLDEFSFYGAMRRRPSLQLLCNSYGIPYAKEGVGGEDITELFTHKKFRDIAEKNAADVIATTELFEKWKVNLAPASFINGVEF
ncbi:MAG: DNA polymerase elongation subunit (family B) [Candidatus Paceibacteria bacterium]|jgi:DNA polymerase elongation subunit (family B)